MEIMRFRVLCNIKGWVDLKRLMYIKNGFGVVYVAVMEKVNQRMKYG